jgi:hypothetical protein
VGKNYARPEILQAGLIESAITNLLKTMTVDFGDVIQTGIVRCPRCKSNLVVTLTKLGALVPYGFIATTGAMGIPFLRLHTCGGVTTKPFRGIGGPNQDSMPALLVIGALTAMIDPVGNYPTEAPGNCVNTFLSEEYTLGYDEVTR